MKLLTYIIILSFISCSSLTQPSVTAKAIIITGQQLDSIRTIFEKPIANCNIDIIVLKKADTLNYDSTSSVDTNVNILQVRLPGKQKDIETDIAVSNSFGNYTYSGKLGDTVLCEQSPNHWFLAWFDEPFYKSSVVGNLNENHRYELHIRAIEKGNGNITADETLYTKDCCLDRLDIKYNPYTESLLFAFNDFGGKDYKLMYGFIEIGKINL